MLEENEPEIEVAPETPEAPAADAAPAETPEWDGSLDTFEAQPWAKSIPDAAREHIKGQYERHTFYRGLVDSDDSVAKLTQELDGLRTSLGAEVKKYQTEAKTWQDKHAEIERTHKAYVSEVEAERIEAKDKLVRETYPDIYETYAKAETDEAKQNSALAMFAQLVEGQGIPMERAAKMVRAAFDMPTPGAAAPAPSPTRPAERDVQPPPSVALQAKNGLNPAEAIQRPKPETPEEARRRVLAQIEAEEAAAGG